MQSPTMTKIARVGNAQVELSKSLCRLELSNANGLDRAMPQLSLSGAQSRKPGVLP